MLSPQSVIDDCKQEAEKKIAWTLPNCRSICCKILCAAWWFIVCAHKFSLAEWNFQEKSPVVQADYRSIHHEISCELSCELLGELSSKNHENKKRNSHISLALLLHNTVCLICIVFVCNAHLVIFTQNLRNINVNYHYQITESQFQDWLLFSIKINYKLGRQS